MIFGIVIFRLVVYIAISRPVDANKLSHNNSPCCPGEGAAYLASNGVYMHSRADTVFAAVSWCIYKHVEIKLYVVRSISCGDC